MMKTAVGRLNTGVPQIPPKRGDSLLTSFQETLPIYRHTADISQSIEKNQVVLITGETGSGKTTQVRYILLYILPLFIISNVRGKIFSNKSY